MATEKSEVPQNTNMKSNDANAQTPIVLSGAAHQKKPTPDGVKIEYFQITVRFLDETPSLEVRIDVSENFQVNLMNVLY